MANILYGTLFGNVQHVIGDTYQIAVQDEEAFLRDVVTPIYDVLLKVSPLFTANLSNYLVSDT